MIQYNMQKPQGALADYVRFFWSLEAHISDMPLPFVHRALPDNCVELIFYCKGKLSISSLDGDEGHTFDSGIFGQVKKFRQFRTNSDFSLFGVYLYPYSFKTLFNLPVHHLSNEMIDTGAIWGAEGKELEEKIMLAKSNEQRIHLISRFLLARIKTVRNQDSAFVKQIKSVIDHNSLLSVSSFADDCNLSRRQFERKFKEFAGFSPKDFFNIVRFKNVLKEVEQNNKSLAQIAINAGYYDQSHFANEFRKLAGYTPKEFVLNNQEEVDIRATRDFKH